VLPHQRADGADETAGLQRCLLQGHHPQRGERLRHGLVEERAEPLRLLAAGAVVRSGGVAHHLDDACPRLPELVAADAVVGGGLDGGVDVLERAQQRLQAVESHVAGRRRLLKRDLRS
jgi:hypothetical protein